MTARLPHAKQTFRTRDVASLLRASPAQIRALARAGFVQPERSKSGDYFFSFQDIVLLRTAHDLRHTQVPQARLERALSSLKQTLPPDQPLSSLRIEAEGERILISDGEQTWDIESHQLEIDFPRARDNLRKLREPAVSEAESWFQEGMELEAVSLQDAEEAYLRAVELDPTHSDAHVNLGRLLHQQGRITAAAEHYRLALEHSSHATAAFNLGIALEDLGKQRSAIQAYRKAIELDPLLADAHYNLSALCQRTGDDLSAIRHLKLYKSLTPKI
jgi:tetratricopeptide (TPR) repeat protein